jgi:hypothetical protein
MIRKEYEGLARLHVSWYQDGFEVGGVDDALAGSNQAQGRRKRNGIRWSYSRICWMFSL